VGASHRVEGPDGIHRVEGEDDFVIQGHGATDEARVATLWHDRKSPAMTVLEHLFKSPPFLTGSKRTLVVQAYDISNRR
jgi:hypothetical protein